MVQTCRSDFENTPIHILKKFENQTHSYIYEHKLWPFHMIFWKFLERMMDTLDKYYIINEKPTHIFYSLKSYPFQWHVCIYFYIGSYPPPPGGCILNFKLFHEFEVIDDFQTYTISLNHDQQASMPGICKIQFMSLYTNRNDTETWQWDHTPSARRN